MPISRPIGIRQVESKIEEVNDFHDSTRPIISVYGRIKVAFNGRMVQNPRKYCSYTLYAYISGCLAIPVTRYLVPMVVVVQIESNREYQTRNLM